MIDGGYSGDHSINIHLINDKHTLRYCPFCYSYDPVVVIRDIQRIIHSVSIILIIDWWYSLFIWPVILLMRVILLWPFYSDEID